MWWKEGVPTDQPLYTVMGQVIHGKHLGARLGFPTANIAYESDSSNAPTDGVYIAAVWVDGEEKPYIAIINQGRHPTVPEGCPAIEAHLLGYADGDLYGHRLTIHYQQYLRPEQQFSSLDALKKQLDVDRETAMMWLRAQEGEDLFRNAKTLMDQGVLMDQYIQNPVEALNISYRYEANGAPAVHQVSLSISKGSFVVVLGRNGSGKSTLAKLLNALYLPTEGRVLICGMDTVEEESLWEVRRHAGMVFQNPDNQIVATVVQEDVAFGLENLGVPQPDMVVRIKAALEAVHMTDFAAAAPHMLSGGQKQRVAVAGVLVMEPDVMILDEATAMLDPSGRSEVLSTVRRLNRDKGITVVWITHFMEEAAFADRVIVLHQGGIAMDGTPGEIFSQVREIKALGLDVPPMAELAAELREAGLPLPSDILTVADMVKELKNTLCQSM